jgi:hypothetical protein
MKEVLSSSSNALAIPYPKPYNAPTVESRKVVTPVLTILRAPFPSYKIPGWFTALTSLRLFKSQSETAFSS